MCLSESLSALRRGVQAALFQLGRVPGFHQTDNSTAATHRIPDGKAVVADGNKRPFNEDYLALMRHFGMKPRTTTVGAKEQNGDVEAGHRALKNRLEQALLIRGSRDLESVEAWEGFVHGVLRKANAQRGRRVVGELATMRPLVVSRLPEFVEEEHVVSEWNTVRVKENAYSVPSRLIGHGVRVRIYESIIEVWFARLPTDSKSKLILPMSHFSSGSTIHGTRRTAARPVCTTARNAADRKFLSARSRTPRPRSSSPRGCSNARFARV